MTDHSTHSREGLGTWTFQHLLLRLPIPRAQEHNLMAYCDGGSNFSCIVDHAVDRLGLQQSVEKHYTYPKWNARYLRCLHRLCPRSKFENGIRQSKWRYLHKIVASVTPFRTDTHTLIRGGKQLVGYAPSIGLLRVEYVLLERLPQDVHYEGDIPKEYWVSRDLEVIDTKYKEDPDQSVDFDVLIGQSEGIFDEQWWLDRTRRRRRNERRDE